MYNIPRSVTETSIESQEKRFTIPEKNKLQTVSIDVGTVHHITNQPEAKAVVVTYGEVSKGWNQDAPYLLFAAPGDYHVIKSVPNTEYGVITDREVNEQLYRSLVYGNITLALKSCETKKHRILVKAKDRITVIATPGHTYAIQMDDGDVSGDVYYALEHGNDLFLFLEKGRRYVVEIPEAEKSASSKSNYVAASYMLIRCKPK